MALRVSGRRVWMDGLLGIALALILATMAPPATARADEGAPTDDGPVIVEDLDSPDPERPLLGLGIDPLALVSPTADSASGFRYVDHIELPDYARYLYDWLEEASDGDGEEDWLIWDEGFRPSSGDCYEANKARGELLPVWGGYSVSLGSVGSLISDDIADSIRAALIVFKYDHPEVFWAFKSYAYGTVKDPDGSNYAILVLSEFADDGDFDFRHPNYRSESAVRSAMAQRDARVDEIVMSTRVMGATTYSRVKEFDRWLTHHNQYNTLVADGREPLSQDVYECLCPLLGASGDEGPVCSGYARALKVLCDRAGIGCVYVGGMAYSGVPDSHAWNLVEVGGRWYAIDVTWDDPMPREGAPADRGPASGRENTDYLLVGSGSAIRGKRFDATHVAWEDEPLAFPDVPPLADSAYDPSTASRQVDVKRATIEVADGTVYTGEPLEPEVTVTYGGRALEPEKEYFLEYEDNVDAGTAHVTVTGMEGFTGTSKVSFRIDKATPDISFDPSSLLLEPDGGAETVEVLGNDGLAVSAKSSDTKVCSVRSSGQDGATLTVTPLKEGQVEISVEVEGDANHYPAKATLPVSVEELVEVWRLYNGTTGEHLFTVDTNEYRTLSATGAWTGEGPVWLAPARGTAVYRVYNPHTGEHLYTADARERIALTGSGGWRDEGPCWCSDSAERVPVMRLYNRWSPAASHLYTPDQNEYDELASMGWKQEGVCWYAAGR